MEDLFRSYWWLLFPLSWVVIAGWRNWLSYRRHRDMLDVIKRFTANGREVPAGLMEKLGARARTGG